MGRAFFTKAFFRNLRHRNKVMMANAQTSGNYLPKQYSAIAMISWGIDLPFRMIGVIIKFSYLKSSSCNGLRYKFIMSPNEKPPFFQ